MSFLKQESIRKVVLADIMIFVSMHRTIKKA